LAATEQRHTDKAAHLEFLAAVSELDLRPIDFAGLRVEYLATLVFVSLLFESPKKRHAEDRLIAVGAVTFLALRSRIVARRRENFFYLSLELPVYFFYPNQTFGLTGVLINGSPKASRR